MRKNSFVRDCMLTPTQFVMISALALLHLCQPRLKYNIALKVILHECFEYRLHPFRTSHDIKNFVSKLLKPIMMRADSAPAHVTSLQNEDIVADSMAHH